MPDMYDKLGEMLNEALESGKIPASRPYEVEDSGKITETENDQTINDQTIGEEKHEESGRFSLKNTEKSKEKEQNSHKSTENIRNTSKKSSKKGFATGEVIKLHKYTYNMRFPPHIQKVLDTLDIAYPFTHKDIAKQYRYLLKQNHPDTKKTIHHSHDVKNNRQKTIDEITEAYKTLCEFFSIK